MTPARLDEIRCYAINLRHAATSGAASDFSPAIVATCAAECLEDVLPVLDQTAAVLAAVIDANHHEMTCARAQHFDPVRFVRSNHTRVREVLWQELNKTAPPCDCYLSHVWKLFDRIKGEGAAQERYEQEK